MTRKFMTPALVGLLCALKIIPRNFIARIAITLGAMRKSAPSAGSGTASSRDARKRPNFSAHRGWKLAAPRDKITARAI